MERRWESSKLGIETRWGSGLQKMRTKASITDGVGGLGGPGPIFMPDARCSEEIPRPRIPGDTCLRCESFRVEMLDEMDPLRSS